MKPQHDSITDSNISTQAPAVDTSTTASVPLWLLLVLTATATGALIGGVLWFCHHRRRNAPPHVPETERDAEFSLLDRNLPHQRQAAPNLDTEPPPYTEWEHKPKFVSHHKSLPY